MSVAESDSYPSIIFQYPLSPKDSTIHERFPKYIQFKAPKIFTHKKRRRKEVGTGKKGNGWDTDENNVWCETKEVNGTWDRSRSFLCPGLMEDDDGEQEEDQEFLKRSRFDADEKKV